MRILNKGRHALTAMLYLSAQYNRDRLVTLRELEQCHNISLSYLEQLFSSLRKQGLVTGIRGPGGGYRLGRPPMEITIIDVLGAVDPGLRRQGATQTKAADTCPLTSELWTDLSTQIMTFLSTTSLAEIVERHRESTLSIH